MTANPIHTIWSILTIWHKCSEWSPEGATFTEVKMNAEPESEVDVAVSLSQRIVLLHLDDARTLHETRSIDTDLCPVNITGTVITLDNDAFKMLVYN
ncbi:hypothetical protein EDD85DRAFT_953378 [Armillaria nabsnona]|nr:hypothetical protein EDD85DRAFT_953378 [Armillaria nabsnona]